MPPPPNPTIPDDLAMLSKVFITLTALFFALLSVVPASARIVSISGPKGVLHPGEHFEVTFHTAKPFKKNIEEYYAVFGIEEEPTKDKGLGILLGNGYDLVANGHSESGFGSFKVSLKVPKDLKLHHHRKTKFQLKAAVLFTVRAGLSTVQ